MIQWLKLAFDEHTSSILKEVWNCSFFEKTVFVTATYIQKLKNSKSTFSDSFQWFWAWLKNPTVLYTTSGDGNRALSRDSQLLPAGCCCCCAAVESREARVPYLIHFAARTLQLYNSTASNIIAIKSDQTLKSRASFHDGHAWHPCSYPVDSTIILISLERWSTDSFFVALAWCSQSRHLRCSYYKSWIKTVLDDAPPTFEISKCRWLGSQSLVTDVAIKARDQCIASGNEEWHFPSTCMWYIAAWD